MHSPALHLRHPLYGILQSPLRFQSCPHWAPESFTPSADRVFTTPFPESIKGRDSIVGRRIARLFILYIVFPACQGSEEDLLSADRLRFSRRYLHIDRVPNTMIGFRFFTVLLLRVLFSLAAFLTAEERVQTFFLENPYQNICSKRAWDQYSIEGPGPICNSIVDQTACGILSCATHMIARKPSVWDQHGASPCVCHRRSARVSVRIVRHAKRKDRKLYR